MRGEMIRDSSGAKEKEEELSLSLFFFVFLKAAKNDSRGTF